jgi:hypothetical protein
LPYIDRSIDIALFYPIDICIGIKLVLEIFQKKPTTTNRQIRKRKFFRQSTNR